jgi:hypothetical protein
MRDPWQDPLHLTIAGCSHPTSYRRGNGKNEADRRYSSHDRGKPKNFAHFIPTLGKHDASPTNFFLGWIDP